MALIQQPRRRSGRVLEILVALSILICVAGVTIPIIGAEMRASREERALEDMADILGGLRAYTHDTLFLPTGERGRTNVVWLWGPGEIPDNQHFALGGDGRPLQDVLLTNSLGGPGWQGPYVGELQPDPWGHAYLVNVDGLVDGRETPMILCAGPDGIVDTAPDARVVAGDDIALPLN